MISDFLQKCGLYNQGFHLRRLQEKRELLLAAECKKALSSSLTLDLENCM